MPFPATRLLTAFSAICLTFLCFSIFPTLVIAKPPLRVVEAIVVKVSDGDTINVADKLGTKVKVRLYGIDAPETEKWNKRTRRVSKPGQPNGDEAWKALSGKVYHQRVRLDIMNVDKYKRLVCLVWLGKRNINKEMVEEGWAWAYKRYLDAPYTSEFLDGEDLARAARLGIWQQSNPEPPWVFRQLQKMK